MGGAVMTTAGQLLRYSTDIQHHILVIFKCVYVDSYHSVISTLLFTGFEHKLLDKGALQILQVKL